MIKLQKIIKYVAIGFAIFLIVNIISLTAYGIISIGNIFNNNENNTITEGFKNIKTKNKVGKLEIETKGVGITIKKADKFKIETDNKNIKTKESNNKLLIIEDNNNWFNKTDYTELIIYVPNDYQFDEVSINNGAGEIQIDTLKTKTLNLELGAGQVNIDNLLVSEAADIEGGVGEINITSSSIKNLDLGLGLGKVALNSSLYGFNEIDGGMGELIINLIGTENDYQIKANKGLGKITLNEEKIQSDISYGNGNNLIDISGGIGNISINYSR